jgi:hypothetical protein
MRTILQVFVVLVTCALCAPASAQIQEISPSEVALLPADGTGVARVALRFNVARLAQKRNLHLVGASLEWTGSDLLTLPAVFLVEPITQEWTRAGLEGGTEDVEVSKAADEWEITARDQARSGNFVRLNLDTATASWLESPTLNFGVVLATPSLMPAALARQAAAAKLVVRYARHTPD